MRKAIRDSSFSRRQMRAMKRNRKGAGNCPARSQIADNPVRGHGGLKIVEFAKYRDQASGHSVATCPEANL